MQDAAHLKGKRTEIGVCCLGTKAQSNLQDSLHWKLNLKKMNVFYVLQARS